MPAMASAKLLASPASMACTAATWASTQTVSVADPDATSWETPLLMEGKEVRFGAAPSALWAAQTTQTSNGSVNAMHDSLAPLSGLVTIGNMLVNSIWGGIGCGLQQFLVYLLLSVFLAGLMTGRTPELFGRKIDQRAAHDDPGVRNHCIDPAHVRNRGIDDPRAAIEFGQVHDHAGRARADAGGISPRPMGWVCWWSGAAAGCLLTTGATLPAAFNGCMAVC